MRRLLRKLGFSEEVSIPSPLGRVGRVWAGRSDARPKRLVSIPSPLGRVGRDFTRPTPYVLEWGWGFNPFSVRARRKSRQAASSSGGASRALVSIPSPLGRVGRAVWLENGTHEDVQRVSIPSPLGRVGRVLAIAEHEATLSEKQFQSLLR